MLKKVYDLTGTRCYLTWPIENDTTGLGIDDRSRVKKLLTETFHLDIFDPFVDPKQQWVPILNEARVNRDYEKMTEIAKRFVRKDLCMVDRSDILIAYLPHKMPTTGCHHEIISSSNAKKPTLLVCPQGKEWVPLWYYGFIPHECMFGSWDDLILYLYDIEGGKYMDNDRWDFVRRLI